MKDIKFFRDWDETKKLENISFLSAECTMLFFKELNPNKREDKRVYFKTKRGIHYFDFKLKNESVRSRWRKMSKLSKQDDFVGWIPTSEKMARRLKLKLLKEKE
jgi:hypothetical protein